MRLDLMSIPGFERRPPPLPPAPDLRPSEAERYVIEAALAWSSPRQRLHYLAAAAEIAPELYAGRVAWAAVRIGAYQEAIDVIEGELEGGLTRELRTNLAIALHGVGRHREEWDVVREAMAERPELTTLHNYAAWALAAIGDQQSVDQIRTLLSQRVADGGQPPDLRLVSRAVVELRAHGHPEAGDDLLREAMERVDWYYGRGEPILNTAAIPLLMAAGQLDRAERSLRALMELTPGPDWHSHMVAGAQGELALVAAMRGDRERALALESTNEIDPQWLGYRARARIHFALGDTVEAARLMERALASGMPHYQLRGPECPGLRTVPRFRRLLRGHPTC